MPMNTANKLTLARVFLIPVFLVIAYWGFPGSRYLSQRFFLGSIVGGKLADKQIAGGLGIQRLQTSHIALGVVIHQCRSAYRFLHTVGAGAGRHHVNKGLSIGGKALGDRRTKEDNALALQGAVRYLLQVFGVILTAQVPAVQQAEYPNEHDNGNHRQNDQQHGQAILHHTTGAVFFTYLFCYAQCRGYRRKNRVEQGRIENRTPECQHISSFGCCWLLTSGSTFFG